MIWFFFFIKFLTLEDAISSLLPRRRPFRLLIKWWSCFVFDSLIYFSSFFEYLIFFLTYEYILCSSVGHFGFKPDWVVFLFYSTGCHEQPRASCTDSYDVGFLSHELRFSWIRAANLLRLEPMKSRLSNHEIFRASFFAFSPGIYPGLEAHERILAQFSRKRVIMKVVLRCG